jgi:hypothetical protein
LLDQRRLLPLGLGGVVDRLGLGLLLDLADDDLVPDHHLQGVDRAVVGQGIDIDRLDPVVGVVAKGLGDSGAHRQAADGHVDVGSQPHGLDHLVVTPRLGVMGAHHQGAGGDVAGLGGEALLAEHQGRQHGQDHHQSGRATTQGKSGQGGDAGPGRTTGRADVGNGHREISSSRKREISLVFT